MSLPLGPSTLIVRPLTLILTPEGTVTGFLPRRDMAVSFAAHGQIHKAGFEGVVRGSLYDTSQSSSPPTFSWRAWRSDMTPLLVETMLMPRPLRTLGRASTPLYTRRPGLLMRLISWMTLSPERLYLRFRRSMPCLLSSISSKPSM